MGRDGRTGGQIHYSCLRSGPPFNWSERTAPLPAAKISAPVIWDVSAARLNLREEVLLGEGDEERERIISGECGKRERVPDPAAVRQTESPCLSPALSQAAVISSQRRNN